MLPRSQNYANATARLLSEAGFRHARVEVGWGSLAYNNLSELVNIVSVEATILSLKDNGIRPLILLNANDGGPCPNEGLAGFTLLQAAYVNDKTLRVTGNLSRIVPNYTGLNGVSGQPMAYSFIESYTGTDSDATLYMSTPLRTNMSEGPLNLVTMKYRPFARGSRFENGSIVPWAQGISQTSHSWSNKKAN